MARFEMSQADGALQDIEQVLGELPNPSSNPEAVALKEKILKLQRDQKSKAPQTKSPSQGESTGGFRRMQIVEDDESDEEPSERAQAKSPSSAKAKSPTRDGVQDPYPD